MQAMIDEYLSNFIAKLTLLLKTKHLRPIIRV